MIAWFAKAPAFEAPRRFAWKLIIRALDSKNMTVAPAVKNTNKEAAYTLIRQVIRDKDMLLLEEEAYQVYSCSRNASKITGDIAEVGVYRGGSARLICENKGSKSFHLFDTFEGLPEVTQSDTRFEAGQYKSSLEEVKEYLKEFPGIHIHKGFFPDTAGPVKDTRFSFVHLDVDTYVSTLAGLTFFYPRMTPGGFILIHDYLWAEGVRRAVHEFIDSRPESVVELAGAYCGIVKTAE
jgi:O-methyltransferase